VLSSESYTLVFGRAVLSNPSLPLAIDTATTIPQPLVAMTPLRLRSSAVQGAGGEGGVTEDFQIPIVGLDSPDASEQWRSRPITGQWRGRLPR
jgi:hypothetical protein